MMRMLMANAEARISGGVVLASAVLLGPVLKNKQNTAANKTTHARGNGVISRRRNKGNPASIPKAETRK